MGKTFWALCGPVALAFLLPGLPAARAAEKDAANAVASFEMQEVSVLDDQVPESLKGRPTGCFCNCTTEPSGKVKAYPPLKSKRPLYGTLTVDANKFCGERGIEYHFVLDASGGPAGHASKSAPAGGSGPKGEAGPETETYDLLYFDANGDLDLTNDPVVRPMKEPLPRAFSSDPDGGQYVQVFDCVSLPVDDGPYMGRRSLRIVPALEEVGAESGTLEFVPTVFRRGTICLGKTAFAATLSQACGPNLSGRFDKPMSGFHLSPLDAAFDLARITSWSVHLCEMRGIDGQLYNISATPSGDKLFVKPYRGDFGMLEIAAGGREIAKPGFSGLLFSDTNGLPQLPEWRREPSREYRLPEGDYAIYFLDVDYGRLNFRVRSADEPILFPEKTRQEPFPFPIKIRKDKPYLLDFSAKPAVAFTSPGRDRTFKPGGTVTIDAFLLDPALNVLFGGLTDTTKKIGETSYKDAKGQTVTRPRYALLTPTVEITSASGQKVAGGTMQPFG